MTELRGLHPKLTLSDLYDSNVVYTSRPSYTSNPGLEPAEHQSNFLTGRELLIANQMPVIVHEASVTDKLSQLFDAIGFSIPDSIYRFHDQESYESLIQRLALNEDKKIYFQYVHGDEVLDAAHYALNKETFIALNNKARIEEWTGGRYLPRRQIVTLEDFDGVIKEWDFPFVLKPGDDLPTAGGYGVMICYAEADLEKASRRIHQAEEATQHIIIEQKVEAVANYCVQYAYSDELGLQYLGTAEQLTDRYGFYKGNQNVKDVPQNVIDAGREIMELGVEQGFFGVAGFDLLLDDQNEVYAIDLNFRQNGSTSMLLLEPELNEGYHKFYSYISPCDNTHFFETILKYVKQHVLFPLSYYDGEWYTSEEVPSRFGCIWHASSKEEVEQLEAQFLAELEG
ncbi:L-aspartate--L-methionine ligase LdmS [Staphylococcus auricularis]|mgnify:FL=1|uniref:L-aspartate--L-methionine ligase LdmS n=1 Tax=Staphylococcus auricularis TaxID=29379 RepID=UPI0024307473|nr:ATP-grasp domain-containing protein [Staphylococcus auricularis]